MTTSKKKTSHDPPQDLEEMSLSTAPASPIRDDLGGDDDDDDQQEKKASATGTIPTSSVPLSIDDDEIEFIDYVDESQLEHVMKLVIQDLSEPYSTVPRNSGEPIGCVVGKIDQEEIMTSAAGGAIPPINGGEGVNGNNNNNNNNTNETIVKVPTGYIGMLAVQSKYRRKGIGKALVRQVLQRMKDMGCTSVTLETEVKNGTAQRLYQDCFGFVREELLCRYYLNWGDAYRLRLWF